MIAPDDKTVYVANEQTNNVSVVDIATMKETARYPGRVRAGTKHRVDCPVSNPTIGIGP